MKHAPGWLALGLALGLAGCGPKEPPAPVVTEADQAALEHGKLFGDTAKDPAITWRASGLGLKIITPGEGNAPTPGDHIRLHYTGRLKDGTVFDDTRAKAKPAEFELGRMIPGLVAGISTLRPGGHAVFFIPPSLGYGGMKVGNIPPVSGLIFDVELLAVNPEPAPKL